MKCLFGKIYEKTISTYYQSLAIGNIWLCDTHTLVYTHMYISLIILNLLQDLSNLPKNVEKILINLIKS